MRSGVLNKHDVPALAELAAHQKAVGDFPWVGMQGTGQITFAQDTHSSGVVLTNLGTAAFRLDIAAPQGLQSTRIYQSVGKVQEADGKVVAIPSSTASLGIFPFEALRSVPFPNLATLQEQGFLPVGNTTLHRITYEYPAIGLNPFTKSQNTNAIDFYFDPITHLLVKSACQILLPGARQVEFTSVVTYSDYRLVGASQVPFRYVETLNGELYRTLQLTSVQLSPGLSSTYFQF